MTRPRSSSTAKCTRRWAGTRADVPVVGADGDAAGLAHHPGEHVGEPSVGRTQPALAQLAHERSRVLRRRHQQPPDSLGQAADQRRHQVLAQARDLPVEPVGGHPVEHLDGDVHGDAVLRVTRLEPVAHGELQVALPPGRRIGAGVDLVGPVRQQQVLGERQQGRVLAAGLLPPGVEVPRGHDLRGNPLVVERIQRLVADDEVAPPGAGLQLGEPLDEGGVVVEEPVPRRPVALDERPLDEQVTRLRGVDLRVPDGPGDDDRHAVEGDPFGGDGTPLLRRPARLRVRPLDHVLAGLLGPQRVDAGHVSRPQAGRLDQLAGHDELRLLAEQAGTRRDPEPRTPRAEVLALDVIAGPDMRQQTGEERSVHGVQVRAAVLAAAGGIEPRLLRGLPELLVQVLPLADPQVVEELGLAHPAERAAGQRFLLLLQVAPQVEVCGEVGVLVGEPLVGGVGELLPLERPLPGVLDAHRRHDDEHVAQAAEPVGLEQHPAEPWVDRQLRQASPVCGQPPPVFSPFRVGAGLDRPQLLQEPDAVGDLPGVRRVEEREPRDVAEPQAGHLEDDRREVGPEDLGVGELRPVEVVLLRIQADADAVGEPPAAARPLVGAGLADRLDGQPLDLGALAVAGDPRGAGVHDVADPRHGQRRLGDIGGQHDPATVRAARTRGAAPRPRAGRTAGGPRWRAG